MRSTIKEKIIASAMLMAFAVTNSSTAFAISDYSPLVRDDEEYAVTAPSEGSLDYSSNVRLSNADSIVNLSLRDADVTQVLRMFADQAGMNIIFYPSVEGHVTMDLVNITLEKALDLVMMTSDLSYDIQSNTLLVYKRGEVVTTAGQRQISTIPVKYVSAVAVAAFLNDNIYTPNGIHPGVSTKPVAVVNAKTNDIMIMGTAMDAEVARQVVAQFDKKPQITTIKVNHTTPAEMAAMICNALVPSTTYQDKDSDSSSGGAAPIEGVPTGFASDDDSSASGSGSGSGSGFTVGGGVTACALEQNVENTISESKNSSSGDGESSSSNNEEKLTSFNIRSLTVTYFPTLGTVQIIGGSEGQIELIKDYVAANDKKSPQALLEVQIVSLNEAGTKEFTNTWQYLSKNFTFNANAQGFGNSSHFPIFFAGKGITYMGDWEEGKDGAPGDYKITGIAGKNVGSPTLAYTMNYLISNGKGRVLANPKVILTNGQTSKIDLSSDYVKSIKTEMSDKSSWLPMMTRTVETANDNGIIISITPFISPDGYITLDIIPEYNTIKERLYADSTDTTKDLLATLLSRRKLDLRGIRVKDGETLVIGGMIQEAESKSVTKIPFLGDLPLIGFFFRSTSTQKEKEEMVIMLTPQIIVDNEDAVASDML